MFHYSAKTNAFYLSDSINNYKLAGTWPDDATEVDTETANEFMGQPPTGKVRGGDINGNPSWIDIPPPTQEDLIMAAENEKARKIAYANSASSDLKIELQLGIISDEDKEKLIAWMNYIKAAKAVDTSTAPDIDWPEQPAE